MSKKDFYFQGFRRPTTTHVPDELFDELLPDLTGAEVKVLLYICRRTFGFKKDSDRISLNQIAVGIMTKDGRILDRGTGLSKRHVQRALKNLESKNAIIVERKMDEDGVNEINTYSLNFLEGVGTLSPHGRDKMSPGVGTSSPQGRDTSVPRGRDIKSPGVGTPVSTTTNSNTTNSEQQTENIVVVKKLKKRNFSEEIIRELTAKYAPAYIEEKIEILEWKLNRQESGIRRPGRPIEDPAGWLIRAIEQDYKAPRGFKTRAERAEEEEDSLNQLDEQTKATERRRQEKLAALNDLYGTTQRELDLWKEALDSLQLQMPRATFERWFPRTQLLSLKHNIALIGVSNQQAKEWLENRLSDKIQQTLVGLLDHPIEKLSFEVIDQADIG